MSKNSKGIEVAEVVSDKCIGCQICVAECPVGAIEMVNQAAHVDPEACIGCGKCFEVCPVEAISFDYGNRKMVTPKTPAVAGIELSGYRGIAVFIEVADGKGARVSWELIGKARELAGRLGTYVTGFLVGHEVDDVAGEAIAHGCDDVHIISDPMLKVYRSGPYGKAFSDISIMVKPEIILIGATSVGRDLASIVATRLETGLTADCTGLDIDEEKRILLMTRPTFGGNIMATIFCERHRPQMSTVRPNVFKAAPRDSSREGRIYHYPFDAPEGGLPEIVEFIRDVPEREGIDIAGYPALVVAGRGACDMETMPMLDELARTVGGVVACSRPVVEAGLMPYERQVGQTGKTVAPELYIAVGVSGAVQHLVGMEGSRKIVAVNIDPRAPIFGVADVGIIGDYRKIVPILTAQWRKRMGQG